MSELVWLRVNIQESDKGMARNIYTKQRSALFFLTIAQFAFSSPIGLIYPVPARVSIEHNLPEIFMLTVMACCGRSLSFESDPTNVGTQRVVPYRSQPAEDDLLLLLVLNINQ